MRKIDINILNAYVDADTRFCREYHSDADLIIYGYDFRQSDNMIVWNEFNKVMRGIVVDSKGEIKAQPFSKFFTFKDYVSDNQIICSEGQIITLPDSPFIIKEKVDGTMGLLYWIDDQPYIATQRSFANPNAQKANEILYTKYRYAIPKLNRNYTYVLEVIFPATNVLVDYGEKEDLVMLGILDTRTGDEVIDNNIAELGFPTAKDYTKEYGHLTSLSELQALNIGNMEGFVLTYPETGLKVKLKFDWYEEAHRLINSILTMERMIYKKSAELKKIMKWDRQQLDFSVLNSIQQQQLSDNIQKYIPAFFSQNGIELSILYFTIRKKLNTKALSHVRKNSIAAIILDTCASRCVNPLRSIT